MAEPLFQKTVRTAGANEGLGCLWAGALIPAVVVVMNAFLLGSGQAMSSSLSTFVRVSLPVGLVLAVAFGIAALRFQKRSARALVLSRDGDRLRLTIGTDVELDGPFELTYGWDRVVGGKGMKLLFCDLARGDELLCRLSLQLGAIHEPPADWPRLAPPMDRTATHGGFVVGELPELVAQLRG